MYLQDNVFKQIHHYNNLRGFIDKYKFIEDIIEYYMNTDKHNKCLMYWSNVKETILNEINNN